MLKMPCVICILIDAVKWTCSHWSTSVVDNILCSVQPMTHRPDLGSQAIYSPAKSTRSITIDPSTCHNFSLFKGGIASYYHCLIWLISVLFRRSELMREYRKVDDTVTMRLNRTVAQFRDRARTSASERSKNPEEEACAYFWQDLVGERCAFES